MVRQHLYDAVILISFGGPEGMDDVMPYLEHVLRGKNVPEERMIEVAHHYQQFNGVSPINAHNRRLLATLRQELQTAGISLPVYWGNRNWHPFLSDTLRQMAEDGVHRALGFVTSAFSSYSGCRQYREDIERAQAEIGKRAPAVDKIRVFYNHPGFIASNADHVRQAIETLVAQGSTTPHVLFTAHSIPLTMAKHCRYIDQLKESSRLVAEELDIDDWSLVYQSRSGPPSVPWLGPDVGDALKAMRSNNISAIVVSPIGFVSDHIEVLYDLDMEAKAIADQQGIAMVRAKTAGTHPQFVAMIRELIEERCNPDRLHRHLGHDGPSHDVCPADCCLKG